MDFLPGRRAALLSFRTDKTTATRLPYANPGPVKSGIVLACQERRAPIYVIMERIVTRGHVMGSNGVKSKVVLMVLIAGTVPVVLFSLAVFAIDSGPGRLAVTVAFVLLMAAGSYITARRVIELLHSSYERERELEMQIIKKDKLAAIGLLTAGSRTNSNRLSRRSFNTRC